MPRRIVNYVDDENEERRYNLRIHRQRLRCSTDPFDLYEEEFIQLYRMPQELALVLLSLVEPQMKVTLIPKPLRMLVAVSFLAEGTFQKKIGLSYLSCMSQSVVSRCIKEFCRIVNGHLMNTFIKFPQTLSDMNQVKLQFYEKFNWPGIIGCIDCTHVSMYRPAKRVEHIYLNRHHYHSKNVQLICDYNLKILNVNASYGGSNHDATIWRKSLAKAFLHNKFDARELSNTWLLGDSGYPLQPWLMTPIDDPTNEAERRYNIAHRSARNCVERCNGVLKSRFRCLAKDRCIKYSPFMVGEIINTCATLHNFIKVHNYSDEHDLVEPQQDELTTDEDVLNQYDPLTERLLAVAREIRTSIVHNHFNN